MSPHNKFDNSKAVVTALQNKQIQHKSTKSRAKSTRNSKKKEAKAAMASSAAADFNAPKISPISEIFNKDIRCFPEKYLIEKQIGSGGYGSVHSATRRTDNLQVAIKLIPLCKINKWTKDPETGIRIPTEVVLLHKCQSVKGVIRLLEYFQTKTNAIIIMERNSDFIDLFDLVKAHGTICESNSRLVVIQIVQVLARCQASGVIHRDLKLENVLINKRDGEIKLLDFGLAKLVEDSNHKFTCFKGTGVFKPPEYINKKEAFADSMTVWSIGCFAYSLLFGDVPFTNESEVLAGLSKKDAELKTLSRDCRDFIRQTLQPNPESRPLLQELVNHRWISDLAPQSRQPKIQPSGSFNYEVVEIGERPSASCSTTSSSHSNNENEESQDPRIYMKLRRKLNQ